ncbi:MAG: alanine racemase [Bdellovibrio sp.]
MEMYRRTFAEINLDHLAHNIQLLQAASPQPPFLCPMVKANAYGHGDVELARFLEKLGIRHLGVCLIEEGLRLRHFGVKAEILVFRGFDRPGAEKILQYQMTPVVSTWEQIEHLEAVATNPVGIHLKFDTGMNRLGFRPEEAPALFQRLWQNKKIRLQALVTHLFNGEDAVSDAGQSALQLRRLHEAHQAFKPFNVFCHALNSAGIVSLLEQSTTSSSHPLRLQNWGWRPGLMIYGYDPRDQANPLGLKPVMSLKSQVGSYRVLQPGETVSYGGRWTAPRESTIAVVPIGYADGYHRILSNQAFVLFAGQRVPVVGTVCMDYLMVDVTEVVQGQSLEAFRDQEVVLFGYDSQGNFLSAEELAHRAQSITWEMLTSVGERVPRVYVGQDAEFISAEIGGP